MGDEVKRTAGRKSSPLWDARKSETEQKIIDAATRLFVADGYAATTLAAVAEAAGVGSRTVYLRFGSKVELLKRTIDVAIAGDAAPVALADRDWFRLAVEAPTLRERIDAYARGARALMERAAPLIAVAAQAEAGEPVIAQAAQAGRSATQDSIGMLWRRMRDDGLLHPDADLDWIVATAGPLGQAETYTLLTRTHGWDPEDYEQWLRDTWSNFAANPSHAAHP